MVRSADNRFMGKVPFDETEDTWIRVRQTCQKDDIYIPCRNCKEGLNLVCLFKSGEHTPTNWCRLCSVDLMSESSDDDTDEAFFQLKSGRYTHARVS